MPRYESAVANRTTFPVRWRGLKAKAIAALGGRRLRELVTQRRLSTNCDFAGVYHFSSVRPFAMRMRTWLKSISDGGLIMCYPELSGAAQFTRCLAHLFLASGEWRTLRSEFVCGASSTCDWFRFRRNLIKRQFRTSSWPFEPSDQSKLQQSLTRTECGIQVAFQ